MTRHDCGVRPEELILYKDGALQGARGELAEAHLRACPLCRRWMAEFEETGRILREATPPLDDPAGRAAIRALVEQEARRRIRPRRTRPLPIVVAALALALLIALALPWQRSEARPSVGRFFQFVDRGSHRSALVNGATPAALPTVIVQPLSPAGLAALRFTPQRPDTLPLGLQLAEGQIVRGKRLELRYRNDRGLVMLLIQERAEDARYTLTTSRGSFVIMAGVEVLWQPDPWPDSVAVLTWEQGGVLYSLSPDENPTGPFPLGDARQVVEALLAGR